MTSLQLQCKPPLAACAKCLKNGADWRSRTPDPLITNRVASLKTKAKFVNRRRDAPAITDTYRAGVNRSGDEIAVFHNLCGHRTTGSTCGCKVNRRLTEIATPARLNAEGADRG